LRGLCLGLVSPHLKPLILKTHAAIVLLGVLEALIQSR